MCGTLKRSRTIVTPARGTASAGPDRPAPTPKPSDLNFVIRSASVTWSKSGVSASYMQRLLVGAGRRRHGPVLAGRDDVARDGGVVVSEGRGGRQRRTPPPRPRRSWTWCGTLLRGCSPLSPLPSPSSARRTSRRRASTRPRAPGPSPSPCAPRRRFWGVDEDRAFHSASVLKAMLLVAYTAQRRAPAAARGREAAAGPDDPHVRQRARRTSSSPASAPPGSSACAKTAGMARFRPATPIWGNSRITARDQTRFFLNIDTLLPARHRAYGLRLLRTIVPSQRWGIGRLELPDWRCTSRAAGARAPAPSTTRWRCSRAATSASRSPSSPRTTAPTPRARQTLEGVFRRLL